MDDAGHSQEEEPGQHDGPEGSSDAAGACSLEGEQCSQDDQHDEYHRPLAVSDEVIEGLNTPETIDGVGHRYRWRKDTVGQHGGAAQHGYVDQGLPVFLNKAVESEDAAFTVVIRLHCYDDELNGGEQGYCPDHQRKSAQDEVL